MGAYLATIQMNYFRGKAEGIIKRNIFDRVSIKESNDPENTKFEEEFAIFLCSKDKKATWFLRKKEDVAVLKRIESAPEALPPIQGEIVWLNNLEKAAK
jgi:hypothetical protein